MTVRLPPPDLGTVRECLSYDPETGIFTWRRAPYKKAYLVGKRAGSFSSMGYRLISIGGRRFTAARLAWYYSHGEWPEDEVDHKNMVRDDDRLENLRPATSSQNKANRVYSGGALGVVGVRYLPKLKKYMARIKDAGNDRYLGLFDTKEEAGVAYKLAAKEIYGSFARINQ